MLIIIIFISEEVGVANTEDVSDDDSSDSFSSHFRGYVYAVRIFDLAQNGQLIFTLPISSSIFSMVRVPVQWLAPSPGDCAKICGNDVLGGSEKLFFKFVPKPDCIEEVQLGVWDSKSQKTSTLNTVRLFASSDLLYITHSQVCSFSMIQLDLFLLILYVIVKSII